MKSKKYLQIILYVYNEGILLLIFSMNYLVYLHSIGISQRVLFQMFLDSQDYQWVYEHLCYDFLKKYIDREETILKILEQKNILQTKNIDAKLQILWVQIITFWDKKYPENLKNISHPPYFLYVRWEIKGNDNFFSIVWSRKITSYAKKAWEMMIPKLTEYFTIVSGWAWWCDTLAHKISVDNQAKTIVVFGTGIDITYPVTNEYLFTQVLQTWGALVSIFPLGTPGGVYTFPVRNEIVAGMSSGILILEAWEKSWTLITANLALDQWKDLFVIPGDIFNKNYIGSNRLLKNGEAKLITQADDILEEYNYKVIHTQKKIQFENELQKEIYELLKYNLSLSIDEIIEKSQYDYWPLSLNLSLMELQGMIKKDLFGKYGI